VKMDINGEIRKAVKKDIKKIVKLFNGEPNLIGEDSLKFEDKYIEEYIVNPNFLTLVYEVNDTLIGCVVAQLWKIAKYSYIDLIAVGKEYRRAGVGKELLNEVEKIFKKEGMEMTFMFSEQDNKKMHGLGKKLGYKEGKKMIFFSKTR